jgi:CBS-domain-containing membrane protein
VRQIGLFAYRAAGTAAAIGIMEWLSAYSGEPLWRVPFVTSIVLVTTLPQSEAARPYAVIVGHACACAAGFAALLVFGAGAEASAAGVGLAGLLMLALRAPHPPAGIDAFLIAANNLPLLWAINPVLIGCVLLVLFSQTWAGGERTLSRLLRWT